MRRHVHVSCFKQRPKFSFRTVSIRQHFDSDRLDHYFISQPKMPPKTICVLDNRDSPIWDRFLGAVGVGSFVTLWLSSIASPLVFYKAMRGGNYVVTASLLVTAVLAYLPWEQGTLSRRIRSLLHRYHPRYYRSCRILFEESLPDSTDKIPTFYAVHPHGALGMG